MRQAQIVVGYISQIFSHSFYLIFVTTNTKVVLNNNIHFFAKTIGTRFKHKSNQLQSTESRQMVGKCTKPKIYRCSHMIKYSYVFNNHPVTKISDGVPFKREECPNGFSHNSLLLVTGVHFLMHSCYP